MEKILICNLFFLLIFLQIDLTGQTFESDKIKSSTGDIKITFIGHASLLLEYKKKLIYIDPFGSMADYSKMKKADLILITHDHRDHMDQKAIGDIKSGKTEIVLTETCSQQLKDGIVMKNGTIKTVKGIKIEAVPAYNIVNKRETGEAYHPKSIGNGYIITLGNKRLYIGGDTENIPEMKAFKNIDIAFLPMNLPYTMTPEMAADAAKAFHPKILYPYHFGETDTSKLIELLKGNKEIEIRVRKMK